MITWIDRFTILSYREPKKENQVKWNKMSPERKKAYLDKYPQSWYAQNRKWKLKQKNDKVDIKNKKVNNKETPKKKTTPEAVIRGIITKNFANKHHEHFDKFKKAFNETHPNINDTKLAKKFRKHFKTKTGGFNHSLYKTFIRKDGKFNSINFFNTKIRKPEDIKKQEPINKTMDNKVKPSIKISKPDEKLKTEIKDEKDLSITSPLDRSFAKRNLHHFEAFKRAFNNVEEYSHVDDNKLASLFNKHFQDGEKFNQKKFDDFLGNDGEFDPDQFRDYLNEQKKKHKSAPLKQVDFNEEENKIDPNKNKEKEPIINKEHDDKNDEEDDYNEVSWINNRKKLNEKSRKFAQDNYEPFMKFKKAFNETHSHINDKDLVNSFNEQFGHKGKFNKDKFKNFIGKNGEFDSDTFYDYATETKHKAEYRKKAIENLDNLDFDEKKHIDSAVDSIRNGNRINIEQKHKLKKAMRVILATLVVGVLGAVYWHSLPATHELLGHLWTAIRGQDKDEWNWSTAKTQKDKNNFKWLVKKVQKWVYKNPELIKNIAEKYRKAGSL